MFPPLCRYPQDFHRDIPTATHRLIPPFVHRLIHSARLNHPRRLARKAPVRQTNPTMHLALRYFRPPSSPHNHLMCALNEGTP